MRPSTYLNDSVIINGHNVVQNFKGLCVGDVNGSNLPAQGAKQSMNCDLYDLNDSHDRFRLGANEEFELPIYATEDMEVGGISMILNYPKDLLTIDNLEFIDDSLKFIDDSLKFIEGGSELRDNFIYKVVGNELRVGWFEGDRALKLKGGDMVVVIRGRTSDSFKEGDVIEFNVANNPLCEFADEDGDVIKNVVLKTYRIEYSKNPNIGFEEGDLNNDLVIYPNPAEDVINIKYNIVKDGVVDISLYDVLGEKVTDIVKKPLLKGVYNSEINLSSIQSGVYTCKMVLEDGIVVVKRVVISKH